MAKNIFFFIVMVFGLIFIYKKSTPVVLEKVIKCEISINKDPIKSIEQTRNIDTRESLYFDIINFPNWRALKHYKLGDLKFTQNVFMDFLAKANLEEGKSVKFEVFSDDGFVLRLNGKEVCRFDKDRAFEKTECETYIPKGLSEISINYFQGYGNAGLEVFYMIDNKKFHIGENSQYLKFIKD